MRPEPRRGWREGTGALDQVVSNQLAHADYPPASTLPQLYLNLPSTNLPPGTRIVPVAVRDNDRQCMAVFVQNHGEEQVTTERNPRESERRRPVDVS